MRKLFFSALLVAGCGASLPTPHFERFDVRVTPEPGDFPDVPGVVLLDRGTLYMTVDAKRVLPIGRLRRYHRVKILRPGAEMGVVTVPYASFEAIHGLRARAVSPDGEVWEADPDTIEDVLHESGRRAKRLAVPKAEAGWIVEHTYDLYLRDLRFVEPWTFQADIPTVRSEFAVVVPNGFEVDVRYSKNGVFVRASPERFDTPEGTRFSWSESNLPPRFDEPSMPSRELLAPRAHVIFLSAEIGGKRFTGFGSWDDVGDWFLARVPGWADLSEPTVAEARRVAGETSDDEKALKLQEVIAGQLGWEEGPHVPVWRAELPHPEAVLKAKVGNRTSRGLLLTALLRAAGLNAVPALVAHRTEDVLTPDAPTVTSLTGVVAVIPRAQGPLVLDPSQLTVSADVPSPHLQGTRMVLLRGDLAEVVKVPISTPDKSTSEIRYTLELDRRGDLFGGLKARFTGAEAGALRTALAQAQPEDYATVVNAFLRSRGAGLGIESVSIADRDALRRPLTIEGTVTRKRLLEGDGTEVFVRLGELVGGPEAVMREVRRSPLILGVPHTVDVLVRLTLPEDHETGAEAPKVSEGWSGGQVDLSMASETRRRFRFQRVERRTALEVAPKRYPEYRRFREGVRIAEDQVFSIKRPPPKTLEY